MQRTCTWGFTISFVLLASASLLAQQPPVLDGPEAPAASPPVTAVNVLRLIRFNGTARGAQGQPLAGTVGVTFALYEEQEGGAPLWLETQNVAADPQGRYTALLGATSNEGLPLELFSSSEARWLGTQVQGQPEQPRVLLVAVPYALKAAEAETFSGRKATDFVLSEQLSTQVQEEIETQVGSQELVTTEGLAQVVSGTPGRLAKFTAADAVGDSVVTETSEGRIGVATSTPAGAVEIAPGSTVVDPVNAALGSIVFGTSESTQLHPTILGKALQRPGLHLEGRTGDVNATPDMLFRVMQPDGTAFTTLSGRVAFDFQHRFAPLLRVMRDGRVGIGATSPAGAVEIAPGSTVVDPVNAALGSIVFGTSESTQLHPTILGKALQRPGLHLEGRTGDVNATPDMLFRVMQPDGTAFTTLSGRVAFDFQHRFTPLLRVMRDGNVGIGNSNPTEKLEVAGTVKATAFEGDGSNLTGLAGWSLTGNAGTTAGTNFIGTTDNVPLELKVNNSRLLRLEPNVTDNIGRSSPNVIAGTAANNVSSGVAGGTISGGGETTFAFAPNVVTDHFGTVGGGVGNQADFRATVGGGENNIASGGSATIGGGRDNTASGQFGTIAGGSINTASNFNATVGGGRNNVSDGIYSTVGGGFGNTATAAGPGETVCGGQDNRVSAENGTVGGGQNNRASGTAATVGGGKNNWANTIAATVGGGSDNTASGFDATVAGGIGNTASGEKSVVGGGDANTAGGNMAAVVGGDFNSASGVTATVGGGSGNTASGDDAIVPGGVSNAAQGASSFAAGRQAKALHDGAFVWGDATFADMASSANNQFIARASGGFFFQSDSTLDDQGGFINTSTGGFLSTGGAWTDASDAALKENFTPADPEQILARLATMPVQRWNYKAEGPRTRRLGPTAQDFYAAFGLGTDNKHISGVDAHGVALAAIQALYRLNLKKDERIRSLESSLEAIGAEMATMKDALGL